MTFEILTPTDATLTSVTPRTEKHGDEDVFAISLGLKVTAPNTLLDVLAPGLRDSLYKAVPDQEQLPGVEPATPLLRCKVVETLALASCFEGWTIAIDHGIDESAPITLGGAKVDKFRVVPSEGGSVSISFRVGSNDIDAAEAMLLQLPRLEGARLAALPKQRPVGRGARHADRTRLRVYAGHAQPNDDPTRLQTAADVAQPAE